MKKIILNSPMAIMTEEDKTLPYYIVPKGTVLYYDKSFDEGYNRYITYINMDGSYDHDNDKLFRTEEGGIAPQWLEPIDKSILFDIMNTFPLTKEDIAGNTKSNGLSKDDLADIIRSLIHEQ